MNIRLNTVGIMHLPASNTEPYAYFVYRVINIERNIVDDFIK